MKKTLITLFNAVFYLVPLSAIVLGVPEILQWIFGESSVTQKIGLTLGSIFSVFVFISLKDSAKTEETNTEQYNKIKKQEQQIALTNHQLNTALSLLTDEQYNEYEKEADRAAAVIAQDMAKVRERVNDGICAHRASKMSSKSADLYF